ncbi:Dabb family protein [bacterium]|nr:Dabb family protein [bacterium]
MVRHIVLWTLKDFGDGHPKAENLPRMKAWLEGMKEAVPVIRTLEVGMNFNEIPGSFDICLVTTFDSREDLQIYQDHPEHLRVKTLLAAVRLEKRSIDYDY